MPACTLLLLLALALATGCPSAPLLERAIRARGGTLHGIARTVETDVYAGFPGTWRWRTVFMQPDRYAWTILTADEPNHYLYDGSVVRAFVGEREVATATPATAPLRSHARFTAVAHLDLLGDDGVQRTLLNADELPTGAAAGLRVALADGTTYRLAFDRRMLLLWMSGPVNLRPLGEGELVARFGDFRRVRGYWLPYRTVYEFHGRQLAEERALAVCPNPPGLDDGAFAAPRRLPACN